MTRQLPHGNEAFEIPLLQDDRLELWSHFHYTDCSGRRAYDAMDYRRRVTN